MNEKEGDGSSGDKFADHVRQTEFQTPEQEMAGFKLPPGFEITLFASEPDITKPINMEFDDQGRLWVTQSSEYPIAAGPGTGQDRISILEDTDGDGKADLFTHFDDSLNIPIGVMPTHDGAFGFSIPNVYRFADEDGDSRSERKEAILGPFGYNDTHGMVNNFIRGYDGWVHACHGFTNVSTIAGTDGDSITLVSGNTFRFRPDGSRVEQTTNGRINPFGMAFDERGYLYSVDCHSKPIFQLIMGADYPQWGRKDPSIGYAPEMMSYELGSTALAGLVYYTDSQFPESYRGSFFTGDVVTCRIDRNKVSYRGSTPVAHKEEPFLTSEDPWFRPVDLKTGPDGSIYVADFYNRIIGHYEVALDHPGRDRLSGRIWKITYVGNDRKDVPVTNWSTASLEALVAALDHPHQSIRLKVADRLVEVMKHDAVPLVSERARRQSAPVAGTVHSLWVLHRLDALPSPLLLQSLRHKDVLVRQHALRILGEREALGEDFQDIVLSALTDSDPFIRRTAAEVLARFADSRHVAPLLRLYEETDSADTHLKYTAMLALRENLRGDGVARNVATRKWSDDQMPLLATAMRDVASPDAANFVLKYVSTHDLPQDMLQKSLEFVARYATIKQVSQIIEIVGDRFGGDMDAQLTLFSNIREGFAQRGAPGGDQLHGWATRLADYFLTDISDEADTWRSRPMGSRAEDRSPWTISDAFMPSYLLYFSERHGYPPMATLYSTPFKLPKALGMSVFDNDIHNTETKVGVSRNVVRVKLSENNLPVAEYRFNQTEKMKVEDLVKQVTFDLSSYEGQHGYIEVVDSTESGSIGIGNLEPKVVDMPPFTPSDLDDRRLKAAGIAGDFKIVALRDRLRRVLQASWVGIETRLSSAAALANMSAPGDSKLIGHIFVDKEEPEPLREKLAVLLGQLGSKEALNYLYEGMAGSSRPVQLAAAMVLAGDSHGIELLLTAVDNGVASVDLLAEFKVKELLDRYADIEQMRQITQMLASGSDEREERTRLIEERINSFTNTNSRAEEGKALFQSNCAACHQIGGAGGMIGPQLDGIGNWGVRALTEKILDPNRNIPESFRTYNITRKNGKKESGLYRRTEGEILVFADISGKEFSVPKSEIETYLPSQYTLMPDQFRHTLSPAQFNALMEYLLSVK